MMAIWRIMAGLALALAAATLAGCAPRPAAYLAPAVRVVVPIGYMRRFDAPRDKVLQVATTAVKALGYVVTSEDRERGILTIQSRPPRTSVRSDPPLRAEVLTVSVRDDAGRSAVTGVRRTFVGARETTLLGEPNPPAVQHLWSRVFAEIDARL